MLASTMEGCEGESMNWVWHGTDLPAVFGQRALRRWKQRGRRFPAAEGS